MKYKLIMQLAFTVPVTKATRLPLIIDGIAAPVNRSSDSDQPTGNALIRANSRDSLRATVLR
jgi:hypothetical protein